MDQPRHRNADRRASYPEAVTWEYSSRLRFYERPLESPKSWNPDNLKKQTRTNNISITKVLMHE